MPGMKTAGWKKWIYCISAVALAFAAGVLILAQVYTGSTIRKGIHIEDTDVSWLDYNEARKRVAVNITAKYPTDRIGLVYGDRQWDLMLENINYRYLIDQTLEKAYSVGRDGGLFKKVHAALQLLINNSHFAVETSYNRMKLLDLLSNIKNECDSVEKDAAIVYEKGKIRFIHENIGRRLELEKNVKLVEAQLNRKEFEPIQLQVSEWKPHITYDQIKEISGAVSYFSTRFKTYEVNRSDNIRLACSRLDGIILMPGEEFSMNKALGPRTPENGYKEAPVILNNELIQGIGGGVCQVSSTLYNSVLLAGLDVTERTHHSLPLTYISPGRDATINEDSIDFKFKNNGDYPICLQADVSGDKLEIRILGKKREDGAEIRLKTDTLAVYQPEKDDILFDFNLQPGEKVIERKSTKGYRVVLYRETYKDNKLLSTEKLTEDYYKPVKGKVRLSRDLYEAYLASSMVIPLK